MSAAVITSQTGAAFRACSSAGASAASSQNAVSEELPVRHAARQNASSQAEVAWRAGIYKWLPVRRGANPLLVSFQPAKARVSDVAWQQNPVPGSDDICLSWELKNVQGCRCSVNFRHCELKDLIWNVSTEWHLHWHLQSYFHIHYTVHIRGGQRLIGLYLYYQYLGQWMLKKINISKFDSRDTNYGQSEWNFQISMRWF